MKIPIIICSFNQPTYLQQMCMQWRWYYPDSEQYPIYIFDNGSDLEHTFKGWICPTAKIIHYDDNNFIPNLTNFLNVHIKPHYEYYVITDPDLFIHPTTPPDFLQVFKGWIDNGYHRAGFGLIIDDIPSWNFEADTIKYNERELLQTPVYYGNYIGYEAPLDTTFCMYTSKNSGWHAPMNGKDWSNCVRMFKAFHLTWYLHPEHINPEMDYYFKAAKFRVPGQPSAGMTNNSPIQYRK